MKSNDGHDITVSIRQRHQEIDTGEDIFVNHRLERSLDSSTTPGNRYVLHKIINVQNAEVSIRQRHQEIDTGKGGGFAGLVIWVSIRQRHQEIDTYYWKLVTTTK